MWRIARSEFAMLDLICFLSAARDDMTCTKDSDLRM